MRKVLLLILCLPLLCIRVNAMEFTAPEAPESAQQLLPGRSESFTSDLWKVIKAAIEKASPDLAEAAAVCLRLVVICVLIGILQCFSGSAKQVVSLTGILVVGTLLLQSSGSLIRLGIQTVDSLNHYGKLLLPVLTGALAAQGGVASSGALYAGTVAFNAVLTGCITKVIIPLLYIYLALSIACCAIREDMLGQLRNAAKWVMTWGLKLPIYVFTGYLSITGVVSGTTDASALKAAKLAISGMVPVVGKLVSDASDAVLVSAASMKNAAGIYGLITFLAVLMGPFVKIGIHYLLLKFTATLCGIFVSDGPVKLIRDFSTAMGYLLGATGTVCTMLMISTVCFMRGMT